MKKSLAVLVTILLLLAFPISVLADDDVGDPPIDGGDSPLQEFFNVEIITTGKGIEDLKDGTSNTTVLEIIAPNNFIERDTLYIIVPNNLQGQSELDVDWNDLNEFFQDFEEEAEIIAPNNLFGFVMIIAPNNIIFPNNIIAPNNVLIIAPNSILSLSN